MAASRGVAGAEAVASSLPAVAAVGVALPLVVVVAAAVAAWLAIQSPKILSAAASVGFSRLAGVPVRERERRVDLPKEPVSGTLRRARVVPGMPSCLRGETR